MNKKLQTIIMLAMTFLCDTSFSQTRDSLTAKTYLDLVLNLVSTNLNYGNANSTLNDYKRSVLGAQIGVSFQAGITPTFSLVPEFYFTMKGGKLKANNPLTTGESTVRLYAFELPVLARFHFSNFHINGGPSIAYNFSGTQKIADRYIDWRYKQFEAGMQLGGGYTFHTKRERIGVDLRYNYGLTNISYGREMHNRSFIVSVHISKPWKTNPLASR
ncbi:MAG: porin family protein [Mucilaginibacter sp.]